MYVYDSVLDIYIYFFKNSFSRDGTSWMILCVAGVSGVYRIFPMRRGFRARQIILEMGLDSKLFIKLLQ